METSSLIAERGGKQALETRKVLAALFSRCDGAVQVGDAGCGMTCWGGEGQGREQKTSFLRKEPIECMAGPGA